MPWAILSSPLGALESSLPVNQILRQRLIEPQARIDRHIIDIRLETVSFIVVTELIEGLDILAADAVGVVGFFHHRFRLFKDAQVLEGELDLSFIKHMKEDDFVATMAKVVEAVHYPGRVAAQQISEENHQALGADHRSELMETAGQVGGARRLQGGEQAENGS